MVTLSSKVHAEIRAVVSAATEARNLVRAYAEAETIRQANIADNIALEDIVQEIINRCAEGPGYEADPMEAHAALMGDRTSITIH